MKAEAFLRHGRRFGGITPESPASAVRDIKKGLRSVSEQAF
ncbi:MAG: hypothetical protein ACOC2C_01845 [Cyclonatronaceae bacterium]